MPGSDPLWPILRAIAVIARSWTARRAKAAPTERDHVQTFLEFLDDRRVLYVPYFLEYPSHVVESVRQIEVQSEAALALLPVPSQAAAPIATIRGACRAFLSRAEIRRALTTAATIPSDALFHAVVALRRSLFAEARTLAGAFALDLPPELALNA